MSRRGGNWHAKRLAAAVAALILLAGCGGVEAYDKRDVEMGREWGQQLVGDVQAGRVSWDEAHDMCARVLDQLRDSGDVSDTSARATALGCHETLDDAEAASK